MHSYIQNSIPVKKGNEPSIQPCHNKEWNNLVLSDRDRLAAFSLTCSFLLTSAMEHDLSNTLLKM